MVGYEQIVNEEFNKKWERFKNRRDGAKAKKVIKKPAQSSRHCNTVQVDPHQTFMKNFAEGIKKLDEGNFKEAEILFEEALKKNPMHGDTVKYLIGAYYAEMHDLTERMDIIKKRLNLLEPGSFKQPVMTGELPHTASKPLKILEPKRTIRNSLRFPFGLIDSDGIITHIKQKNPKPNAQ